MTTFVTSNWSTNSSKNTKTSAVNIPQFTKVSYLSCKSELGIDVPSSTTGSTLTSVLDGDISLFIKDYLKWRRQGIND